MKYLSNVLITGVGGGLGEELVKVFSNNGFNVICTTRDISKIKEKFRGYINIDPHEIDFNNEDSVSKFLNYISGKKIDVFINNAFMGMGEGLDVDRIEEIMSSLDVNIKFPIQISQSILGKMKASRSGHIIFITSYSSYVIDNSSASYTMAKKSQSSIAQSLLSELRGYGINVTEIVPGQLGPDGIDLKSISSLIHMLVLNSNNLNIDKVFVSPV